MSHYQTPDAKKEDFRRYLDKSGAIDSLTSVLVGLYEESDRPLESTEYIKKYLTGAAAAASASTSGGGAASRDDAAASEVMDLRRENEGLKTQVAEAGKTIETLRANLKHARAEARKSSAAAREAKETVGGASAAFPSS